jgi:hypothetical protein
MTTTLRGINRTQHWFELAVRALALVEIQNHSILERVNLVGSLYEGDASHTRSTSPSPDGIVVIEGRWVGLDGWEYRIFRNGEPISPENCPTMWGRVLAAWDENGGDFVP